MGLQPHSQRFSSDPALCVCECCPLLYLQDVALLDGGVLQLAGLVLQALGGAADGQAGHYLLRQPEGALTLLHRGHLLLEALHLHQQPLGREHTHTERCVGV